MDSESLTVVAMASTGTLPSAFRVNPREEAQSLLNSTTDSSPALNTATLAEILHDSVSSDASIKGEHKVILNTNVVWQQISVFKA